ncbi:MAG: hypothetical protein ACI4SB_00390 [Acutalibacteraceae bacterium]
MGENKKESKNLFKTREGKTIIILFVIVFFVVGVMDFFDLPKRKTDIQNETTQSQNFIGSFRNMRIDKLLASVKQKKNSSYTESDIDSAVEAVKEDFKNMPWYVSLTKIYFDEEKSDSFLEEYQLIKEYGQSNIITISCDYYVYKNEDAWQSGEYDDQSVILTRENEDSEWVIRDSGY